MGSNAGAQAAPRGDRGQDAGGSPMRPSAVRLTMTAEPERIAEVREAAARAGRRVGLGDTEITDLKTIVTEALSNSIRHAYEGEPGQVDVAIEPLRDGLWVTVRDQGAGIHPKPAIGASSARLGLLLIAALASSMEIRSRQGKGTELRVRMAPQA